MDKIVAKVLAEDGLPEDYCFNWQTADTIASQEGRKVIALTGDGIYTKEELQDMYDRSLELYNDCFGVDYEDRYGVSA